MNEGKRENPNSENAPERERVYAPTHAGSGTLNLRPFQKHGPDEAALEPAEQTKAPVEPNAYSPAHMEPPHAAAVEDKPLSQPEAVGTEPPAETEDEAKKAGGEDGARDKRRAGHHEPEELHVPTVREAKQSARRLTEREKRRRERRRRMVQQPAHSLMNRRVADALIVVEDQVQRVRALIKLINELSKEQGELGRKLTL